MIGQKTVPRDPAVEDWLTNFMKNSTKDSYRSALNKYKKFLKIDDLTSYLKSGPDVATDMRTFLKLLNGKPSKTVKTYSGAVKVFLNDSGFKISDDEWTKLNRRGFLPKRVRAQTRDKKPTKAMMKKILNHCNIKGRALFLFLLSSGARIGETLQLKKDDMELDADPPRVHIKAEYTKAGVGERTVFFSYEARDALKDWLAVKDSTKKRVGGETYAGELVFPWNSHTARFIWNTACDKAGLDAKDNRTGRRVYHIHSLRKFFRTMVGLDVDVIHALMGHVEYLDNAYVRQDLEDIGQAYLDAMGNVSVYAVEDQELRAETIEQSKKIAELQKEKAATDAKIQDYFNLLLKIESKHEAERKESKKMVMDVIARAEVMEKELAELKKQKKKE